MYNDYIIYMTINIKLYIYIIYIVIYSYIKLYIVTIHSANIQSQTMCKALIWATEI